MVIPGFYEFVSNPDLILSGERSVPLYSYIAIFILFLAGFLSILKYRLMDIEIVIHRSIFYFLVSGISILLYILVFGLLNWTFNLLVGRVTFTAYLVSALIVAFLFRPLLTRIEQLVDQLFYREKVALQKTLGTLSQALITVRSPKRIFQKVFQTVKDSIHIRSGALWLLDQHPGEMKPVFTLPDNASPASLSLDSTHPLILEFLNIQKGLTRYQIETEPRFSDQQDIYLTPFQKTGMSIFLPLIYKNTLLGVIGFSEKRSGEIYSSNDVMLLTAMAHQTAVAIENARAYLQTETLNAELTKQIKKIAQQHDEILSLQKRLLNENIYLREEIKLNFNFDEIIGSSPAMTQVLSLVEKIAPTISTVLLRGESGTGKEIIARAIHFNSTRKDGPFVKVNCAAIPANLLESELFGHEKGALFKAACILSAVAIYGQLTINGHNFLS